jgi:hypothetical protein
LFLANPTLFQWTSDMPHPLSNERPVRWGILGCGQVAGVFARDVRLRPDQLIAAVASLPPLNSVCSAGRGASSSTTFFHPTSYTIIPHGGNGQDEIAEVSACLRAGRRESLRRPLAETLAVMRTMDALR